MRSLTVLILACVPMLPPGRSDRQAATLPKDAITLASEDLIKRLDKHLEAEKKLFQAELTTQSILLQSEQIQRGHQPTDAEYVKAESTKKEAKAQLEDFRQTRHETSVSLDDAKAKLNKATDQFQPLVATSNKIRQFTADLERASKTLMSFRSDVDAARHRQIRARRDREPLEKIKDRPLAKNDPALMKLATEALQPILARETEAGLDFDDAISWADFALDAHQEAAKRLRTAVDELNKELSGLTNPTTLNVPGGDGRSLVRRAGFASNRDRHPHRQDLTSVTIPVNGPIPGELAAGGGPGMLTPAADLPPGVLPLGVGGVIFDGDFDESMKPNPPIRSLDPPVARTPARPPGIATREVFGGDPASVWVEGEASTIDLLPHPDDPKTVSDSRPDPSQGSPTLNLATAGSANTQSTDPNQPPSSPSRSGNRRTRTLVFDAPATFPIVRFKDKFTSYEDEGMRISEGMTLRVADDGSYQVEFHVAARATPLALRLQFNAQVGGRSGTITLPALVLDPRTQNKSDEFGNTWHVVHRGRSSFLRLALDPQDSYFALERDGTARFGSGVPPQVR